MKDEQKISQNRQKKEGIIAEISEKVEKSKGFVFTNYQGLTHQQLETLKKAVKKLDAEFVATKNTLLLRTLSGQNLSDEEKAKFEQPTATLFMYSDPIEPIKYLAKTIKELSLPTIKFGIIDGQFVNDTDVVRLSTLPPLPTLRAQFLGQLQSPIQGLHRALSWNMQKLVLTLNAVKDKKQV